jgi:hypothetical protein
VPFIEVKGRAGVGVVALSENEYRTAQRLKADYWLYAVFNCGGRAELHPVWRPRGECHPRALPHVRETLLRRLRLPGHGAAILLRRVCPRLFLRRQR